MEVVADIKINQLPEVYGIGLATLRRYANKERG